MIAPGIEITGCGRLFALMPSKGPSSGLGPTGRRFKDVDEIYVFHVRDGKVASVIGVEDNLARMLQIGIRWKGREAGK